ncbi:MAG: uridine diphosphate-N-acetylglucosamine-binding protein YvcK [Acidobacteriota bacterium]
MSIGGGTGLAQLLSGLKRFVAPPVRAMDPSEELIERLLPPISDLTAVVTVTDDGGSSGRLRDEFQILPPGDIRKCLVALSEDEHLMARLFQYRFEGAGELQGHSFGNLFLTALTNVTGDFLEAIRLSSEVLAIQGRILPSTTDDIRLVAELENGASLYGESLIGRSPVAIRRIGISPASCSPLLETLQAIRQADVITLGPGSLYTSLLPNLLVPEILSALQSSTACRIYISNIMTQPGETFGFRNSDHLAAIEQHCDGFPFDYVLCNLAPVSVGQARAYAEDNAVQVENDVESLKSFGTRVVMKDLLADDEKVRHDPLKVSLAILEIAAQCSSVEMLQRLDRLVETS